MSLLATTALLLIIVFPWVVSIWDWQQGVRLLPWQRYRGGIDRDG